MTKEEYLNMLGRALSLRLPAADRKDVLRDYADYFSAGEAEGKTDNEMCLEFGEPGAVARALTADFSCWAALKKNLWKLIAIALLFLAGWLDPDWLFDDIFEQGFTYVYFLIALAGFICLCLPPPSAAVHKFQHTWKVLFIVSCATYVCVMLFRLKRLSAGSGLSYAGIPALLLIGSTICLLAPIYGVWRAEALSLTSRALNILPVGMVASLSIWEFNFMYAAPSRSSALLKAAASFYPLFLFALVAAAAFYLLRRKGPLALSPRQKSALLALLFYPIAMIIPVVLCERLIGLTVSPVMDFFQGTPVSFPFSWILPILTFCEVILTPLALFLTLAGERHAPPQKPGKGALRVWLCLLGGTALFCAGPLLAMRSADFMWDFTLRIGRETGIGNRQLWGAFDVLLATAYFLCALQWAYTIIRARELPRLAAASCFVSSGLMISLLLLHGLLNNLSDTEEYAMTYHRAISCLATGPFLLLPAWAFLKHRDKRKAASLWMGR